MFSGRFWLIRLVVVGHLATVSSCFATEYGKFPADPEGKLVGEDLFELSKDFEYYDPDGVTWRVSAPFKTDGASIPRVFWSFIGHPLGGKYRYAAIVHDYFCRKKYPDWKVVHKNFLRGMLAKGVSQGKAWVMYQAVYLFGLGCRWQSKPIPAECRPGPKFDPPKCIMNNNVAAGKPLPPLEELNKENLTRFVSRIRERGFENEAAELLEVPAIKKILSR